MYFWLSRYSFIIIIIAAIIMPARQVVISPTCPSHHSRQLSCHIVGQSMGLSQIIHMSGPERSLQNTQ